MKKSLAGKVALVAGATRGAGRGIAVQLGAAGATVYVTGRTTRSERSEMNRPETIEETAALVDEVGGRGIAVQVDHLVFDEVRALVTRIEGEQGGLHVLVNDIWGATTMEWNKSVWESSRYPLSCTPEVRQELERLSKSRTDEARLVERARIVLGCLAGRRNDEVAAEFGTRAGTVATWRNRFAAQGMAGLRDRARSGKPPRYPRAELSQRILKQLEQPPPTGFATWDGGMLAEALGVSDDAVWRVLRKEGVQLRRQRSWCVSTDPEFSAKAADIIGLYLNPPENALVLSIDEKPSIQALERRTGYVYTSSGKIVRGLKSTYKRHGTINLFAALNVITGAIHSKTTTTKKRPDFQAFLDEVVADVSTDQEIHAILDNYTTHKKNDAWLAAHPNVHFHFTPTSASWLNQVEIWFGILGRKTLRGASFASAEQLVQAIQAFVAVHNQNATPFVWRKREVRGSQLRNTISNLHN